MPMEAMPVYYQADDDESIVHATNQSMNQMRPLCVHTSGSPGRRHGGGAGPQGRWIIKELESKTAHAGTCFAGRRILDSMMPVGNPNRQELWVPLV